MKIHTLFPESPAPFRADGATFDAQLDGQRLESQLDRVREFMRDGRWHTLAAISRACGGSEPAVSARLRDMRKPRFGAWTVERRRIDAKPGVWEYRACSTADGGPR